MNSETGFSLRDCRQVQVHGSFSIRTDVSAILLGCFSTYD